MRVAPRAVAAILTVFLHLLILSALVRVTARVVGLPPQAPAGQQDMTADKLYGAGQQTIRVDIVPGLSTDGLACAGSSYVGVGVTADPSSERIILVGDNTPAARAGLQHGDIVLNPAVWRDAHREGTVLHLLILRDGVTIAMVLRVGKICIG
ncbi:MAG TPA: hypothetical protein VIO33_10390 [Burkholderiaceae bacterium]